MCNHNLGYKNVPMPFAHNFFFNELKVCICVSDRWGGESSGKNLPKNVRSGVRGYRMEPFLRLFELLPRGHEPQNV